MPIGTRMSGIHWLNQKLIQLLDISEMSATPSITIPSLLAYIYNPKG